MQGVGGKIIIMKKQNFFRDNFFLLSAVALIVLYGINLYTKEGGKPATEMDRFAQCLKDKGAKLYGTSWCSYCKRQKDMFGSSLKKLSYQECALPGSNAISAICKKDKVNNFPTWTFADGTRETGVVELSVLAEKTGCKEPATATDQNL